MSGQCLGINLIASDATFMATRNTSMLAEGSGVGTTGREGTGNIGLVTYLTGHAVDSGGPCSMAIGA